MYKREADGLTIRWRPDDEAAAEQAMMDVVDRFDGWKGSRYDLDNDTAAAVRERYDEIRGDSGA